MLRITEQRDTAPNSRLFILEGRLIGPWVEELQACSKGLSAGCCRRTTIDLTGVTFIDTKGKMLLARLWKQGVELRASGCLTRSLVEDITRGSRAGSISASDDKTISNGGATGS